MKNVYKILFIATFSLTTSYGQSKQKVCQPLFISFKNFQKKSINLFAGVGTTRSHVDKRNYWDFNGQLGINYFPINYFEIGLKFMPTISDNKVAGKTTLFENNFYFRYYPFQVPCYKMAVLTGVSVFRNGAEYSVKGDPISRNKLFPAINAGLILVPKPTFQFESYSEIFFNRPVRFNLGIIWYFKNIKMK